MWPERGLTTTETARTEAVGEVLSSMRLLEDQTAYDSMTGRNGWDGVFLDAQDVMFVSRQVNPYSLLRKHKVDHES